MTALWVALGAALGAPLRFATMHWLRTRYAATPTAGTLTVNVAGSFVLGYAVAAPLPMPWLGLVGAGFCGALTTFSTFGLDLWEALVDERPVHAVANVVLSLALGITAAGLGWALAG